MNHLFKTSFMVGFLLVAMTLRALPAESGSPAKISFTEEENSVVRLSCTPWESMQPFLTQLIDDTAKEPKFEVRQFCFQVDRDAWTTYHKWTTTLFQKYRYPIGISTRNARCEGDRVDGVYQIYHIELTVHNHTKKEEFVREGGKYKFFGGQFDETLVNERTFYNLMVRAGFNEDDFQDGQTGLQGRVAVKPIRLKSSTLEECYAEVREILLPALEKAIEQYITFVFNLSAHAKFTINDLITFNKGNIVNQFYQLGNLGTICEPSEKRLYLVFANGRRQKLDLHGFEEDGKLNGITQAGALKLVCEYIQEQYNNFGDECIILTGKGKHENAGGARGVLHSAFKNWMKDENIKPLIKSYHPYGEGGFRVLLKKPIVCDLSKLNPVSEPGLLVLEKLKEALATGEDRILIKSADPNFEQLLMRSIIMERSLFMQGMPTISFRSAPGEMRVTLSKEHELLTLVVDSNDRYKIGPLPQQAKSPDQKPAPKSSDLKKDVEQQTSMRGMNSALVIDSVKPEPPRAVGKQHPKPGQAKQKAKAPPAASHSKPTAGKAHAKAKPKNKKPTTKQQGNPKQEK